MTTQETRAAWQTAYGITMKSIASLEKPVRPIALFGLVSCPLLLGLGFGVILHPPIGEGLTRTGLELITRVLGVAVVLSMALALIVAESVLSQDTSMTSRTKSRWALALIYANLVAGCVFILWRWRRDRRTES
jgi:hypothetical protein